MLKGSNNYGSLENLFLTVYWLLIERVSSSFTSQQSRRFSKNFGVVGRWRKLCISMSER